MDFPADGVGDLELRVVKLRAVPCARHSAYETDCADCLTGEQAHALGLDVATDERIVKAPLLERLRRR